jgi:hypothetical protein
MTILFAAHAESFVRGALLPHSSSGRTRILAQIAARDKGFSRI